MARCIYPYHPSCQVKRTAVISSMPSFCSSEAVCVFLVCLCHRSIRSWQGHCSWTTAGQWCLLPMFCYHEHGRENTGLVHLPCISGERCLVIRTGKSFLNFPRAMQNLGAMAHRHSPSRAQHVTQVAESGFHIKHGAVDIHFSHSFAMDGSILAITPVAGIVWVGHQSFSDATAPFLDQQLACEHSMELLHWCGTHAKMLPAPLGLGQRPNAHLISEQMTMKTLGPVACSSPQTTEEVEFHLCKFNKCGLVKTGRAHSTIPN